MPPGLHQSITHLIDHNHSLTHKQQQNSGQRCFVTGPKAYVTILPDIFPEYNVPLLAETGPPKASLQENYFYKYTKTDSTIPNKLTP